MTNEESKTLLQFLLRIFPDINYWLRLNSPEPLETLRSWQRVLAQVPYRDAKAVVDGMELGKVPLLEPYHRARTAIYIVELARERAQHRKQAADLIERREEFKRMRRMNSIAVALPGARPGTDGATQ